ncbi:MAG: redoxin domain-containing protein [Fimbriimonadales bacterium]|nr:redoxin domain-containing protein [Fimbriimonadales bacterium]
MPLRVGSELPSFDGATEWLNGEPDWAELSGKPLLVHFWAVSCHICHENLPVIARWRDQYGPKGLGFVSVHMPRQEADLDVEEVRRQVAEHGIVEPCAVDNRHCVAENFENQYVPAYFLFDAEGKMRSRAAGANGLKMLQAALDRLLEA